MYISNYTKQLTELSDKRLGSHDKRHLLFSLVYLILC